MNKLILVQRAAALVLLSISAAACAGGLGGGGLDGLACPELRGGALEGSFTSSPKANATLRAFVQASGDLSTLSAKIEAEVGTACEKMGKDLGLKSEEMGEGTAARCNALNARIDAIVGAAGNVKATFTPPECHASAQAQADCSGVCSGHVDPGSVVANCDPGKLSGTCEGTCDGACDGVCNGDCAGECAGRDAKGQCAGRCKGTCHGSCNASCHSSCSGKWKAPRCDADVTGPSADAKCNASCKAHAEITAECTEPKVNVVASATTGDMAKLVATLQANLPVLIRAEIAYGKRIADDIKGLVKVSTELPSVIGQAGAHAAACVAASASAIVHAQASISVSVQASASVSGKAGVHGS